MDKKQDNALQSVETATKKDGSWQAVHVPSGRVTHGLTEEEAIEAMRQLLEVGDDGGFSNVPLTSPEFKGKAQELALFLEGEVSSMLAMHSGYARLKAYDEDQIAHIELGGGCKGCPSSTMTLIGGVKTQLQDHFGEDVIVDVLPYVGDLDDDW